jgi:hypothetical protein
MGVIVLGFSPLEYGSCRRPVWIYIVALIAMEVDKGESSSSAACWEPVMIQPARNPHKAIFEEA